MSVIEAQTETQLGDKKQFNSEFFSILSATRRLTAQLKCIDTQAQLDAIKLTIDGCFEKRSESLVEVEQERFEKLKKVSKLKEMMAAQGLTLEDLGISKPVKVKNTPGSCLPMKYRWTCEDGSTREWHGMGRYPTSLKVHLEAGRTKEEFLII